MSSKSHFFKRRESGDPNLVAWYKFENNINDETGNNNGISSANLTYASDLDGFAGSFNGFSSSVTIPDSDDFSFTDGVNDVAFKIELNWKCNRLTGTQVLLNKRDNLSIGNEWQIATFGNDFRIYLLDFDGAGFIYAQITDALIIDEYYDIVVDYDGSGLHTGLKITVNGVESTFSTGTYSGMSNTNSQVIIGDAGWSMGSGLGAGGLIDNVKIYKY